MVWAKTNDGRIVQWNSTFLRTATVTENNGSIQRIDSRTLTKINPSRDELIKAGWPESSWHIKPRDYVEEEVND